MKKRILAMLLAAVMVVTLAPAVFAADAVKEVGTEEELAAAVAEGASAVKLTADIDLHETLWLEKSIDIDLGGHTITAYYKPISGEINEDYDPMVDSVVIGVPEGSDDVEVSVHGGKVIANMDSRSEDEAFGYPVLFMEYGTASLKDLTVEGVADVLISDGTVENCVSDSWLIAAGNVAAVTDSTFAGLQTEPEGHIAAVTGSTVAALFIQVSSGVDLVDDCELGGVRVVGYTKIPVYEGPDYQETKDYYTEMGWTEDGHIGTIQNSTVTYETMEESLNVAVYPYWGGTIELIKNVTIDLTGEVGGTAIQLDEAGIGTVEHCEINVSSPDSCGIGVNNHSEIGAVKDTKINITGEIGWAAIQVDEADIGSIEGCTLNVSCLDGRGIWTGSACEIGAIKDTEVNVTGGPSGEEGWVNGIEINESTVDSIDGCTVNVTDENQGVEGDRSNGISTSMSTVGSITDTTVDNDVWVGENVTVGDIDNLTVAGFFNMADGVYDENGERVDDVHNSLGNISNSTIKEGMNIACAEMGSITGSTFDGPVNVGNSQVKAIRSNAFNCVGDEWTQSLSIDHSTVGAVSNNTAAGQIAVFAGSDVRTMVGNNANTILVNGDFDDLTHVGKITGNTAQVLNVNAPWPEGGVPAPEWAVVDEVTHNTLVNVDAPDTTDAFGANGTIGLMADNIIKGASKDETAPDGWIDGVIKVLRANGELVGPEEQNGLPFEGEFRIGGNGTGVIESVEAPLPPATFSDVKDGDWFADQVEYVVANELMKGKGGDQFKPLDNITRAEFITILARRDGVDTDGGANWYEKAMAWSVDAGVSDGTSPLVTITREQLATMLYRLEGKPAADVSKLNSYPDASSVHTWTDVPEAMAWAVEQGLIKGADGKLNPQGTATRAETAIIMQRYCVGA